MTSIFIPTAPSPSFGIGFVVFTLVIVGLVILLAMIAARRLGRAGRRGPSETGLDAFSVTDNPSTFMAASMQGVIEKLRAQEKELARLHLLAQERAQESERLTEEVTRNMPTGLLIVSATGAISSSNPAAEDALGVKTLRYRSYREILGSDSPLARMLAACLFDGATFQREEVEHHTVQGDVRRLGVTISPIFKNSRTRLKRPNRGSSADDKVTGALCLISDLSELSALQKQMRWKENLAALGEMSAGIAHEFKDALATISGYAEMIRNEVEPGDTRDSAERILDQTQSLANVVTEFMKFAKPLEISFEIVPLMGIVELVAAELQGLVPESRLGVSGAFHDLPGDEALIRQALLNLTRNAAEAARAAGRIPNLAITGSVEELGGRKWQRICVSDNGPGIPEADISKIFLPFFTTKSEGKGLGLAVVQKVALQHGGSIEARNRTSGGADFMLWLPLRQDVAVSLFPSQAAHI